MVKKVNPALTCTRMSERSLDGLILNGVTIRGVSLTACSRVMIISPSIFMRLSPFLANVYLNKESAVF